jgi:hypothetical protein
MKKITLITCVLVFVCPIAAQNIDVSKYPTIQVTGTAELFVVPDEVSFSLNVSKSDKSLTTAKAQHDENIAKLIALSKRMGVDPKDVTTDFISVREKYDRRRIAGSDDEFENVFAGYTVSKTLVVKLRDMSKFEEFFSEALKIGVSEVSGVSFQSSQLRKYKDQARAMAIRAAREKAEGIVKEIGQTIGKAVSIEEENVDAYRSASSNISGRGTSTSDNSDGETFSAGAISVKAQVEVQFLLN